MLRVPVKLAGVIVAAAAISGTSIALASAHTSRPASRHGTEHFLAVTTSPASSRGSVVATGLFTDGGTFRLFTRSHSNEFKLGAGTIRVTITHGLVTSRHTACLETLVAKGRYTLGHGTGHYAGIRGTGRYTSTFRIIYPRTRKGGGGGQRPLTEQDILSMSGTAKLRR